MANPIIRMFAFYLGKTKAATISAVTVKFSPNREPMFDQDGNAIFTSGAIMLEFSVKGIVPTKGSAGTKILDKIVANEDIEAGIIFGGKRIKKLCACRGYSADSESETGKASEEITLSCSITPADLGQTAA